VDVANAKNDVRAVASQLRGSLVADAAIGSGDESGFTNERGYESRRPVIGH
jgi:hypothetical protein